MRRCPVCGTDNSRLECKTCGFDGSCDYERYPTLGTVGVGVASIPGRKAARSNVLSCPGCGGTQFSVDVEKQTYLCTACGHELPMGEPGKKPRKEKTADQDMSSPGKKRQRTKYEKNLLRLGWLLIPCQALLFGNAKDQSFILLDDPFMAAIRCILLAFSVFIQLRICLRGFTAHKSKIGVYSDAIVYSIWTFLMVFMLPVLMISIYHVWSVLVLLMTELYHLIFYFGMKYTVMAPIGRERKP